MASKIGEKFKEYFKDLRVSLFKSIFSFGLTIALGFTLVIGGGYLINQFFFNGGEDARRVKELSSQISELSTQVLATDERLRSGLDKLGQDLSGIQATVDGASTKIDRLGTNILGIKKSVADVGTSIDGIYAGLQESKRILSAFKQSNKEFDSLNTELDNLSR